MADLLTEVYVSIDGINFNKIDLSKNESIKMKYILKDTSELSKVFSTFSLSFTFPGTLNNQRIFGFVNNTKVIKEKSDSIFKCKIYSNGLLNQIGKLKLTEIREESGFVKSFTGNFTTSMLSLTSRMGDDLINSLPTNTVGMNWLPNEVFESLSSIKVASVEPMVGLQLKYYVPLISNTRIFQKQTDTTANYLDNVKYSSISDPASSKVLKSEELVPAIQGRVIMDMIKKKYNLDIEMPLENKEEYNDWYILCNSQKAQANEAMLFDIINQFGSVNRYRVKNSSHIPNPPKYSISANLITNIFDIFKNNGDPNYDKETSFAIVLNNVTPTKAGESVSANFIIELENGAIKYQDTAELADGKLTVSFKIKDGDFTANHFRFYVKIKPNTPIIWKDSACWIDFGYYDGKYGPFNSTSYGNWKQSSENNNNSSTMGGTKIDFFKALPEMKCTDFLISFIKLFNISILDASPNNDKLFWLTQKDLLEQNKPYSKKVVDYTDFIVSKSITKTIASDYNYYNFKHKTSKYKSNADYQLARGVEFGQTTYPSIKPTSDLNEFKVETSFCILEALPIAGMSDEFTSYGFTNETSETLVGGEKRYKPNTEDFTIFFACGLRNLDSFKTLGFQKTTINNNLAVGELKSYIKTSPVHPNGFSFGFSLIQDSTIRSLYYDYYKYQTERLLNPNSLKQNFKLKLPASELVLNYKTIMAGMSQVPDGFRLQNEIILQEDRFSIIDAEIDVTTGDSTMNLLNF